MPVFSRRLSSASPDETCAFAQQLAGHLRGGDVLLLDGPIGAGKTHFARCLIQALLPVPEDVPSPTFTLVQTYEADGFEIWHVDLYRIGGEDGCVELGLTEAFDHALCLVEWPDRLGALTPGDALTLRFGLGTGEDDRAIVAEWTDARWNAAMTAVAA